MKIKVLLTRPSNASYFNTTINSEVEVELEEYVAAVVASEISNSNLEACCAQAIAARTFAVSRGVLEGKTISDSSATAQAYRAERFSKEKYPNCVAAAEETANLILTYKGKPISAVYSSSNGGRTVSSKEKWGGSRAYLIEQDDPWDKAASGGRKTGHGVGMSQAGCKWAGAHGYSYKQILKFYYPNTEIKQVMPMNENEKAKAVVELAKSCLGYPYVFAAWGENCTPENRKRRARADHPTIISKCQVLNGKKKGATCKGCKYEGTQIFDCRGFTYYCLKENGIVINGQGATSQWNDNANWIKKGPIAEMPDVVCCIFQQNGNKMKHTGLHIGGGKVIHCSVEVKNDNVSRKDWTHYAIPYGLYTKEELDNMNVVQYRKTIKKGSKGDEVKELQNILKELGLYTGEVDGKFGSGTAEAVRQYQASRGLTVDGVVGTDTWNALLAEGHWPDGAPEAPEEPEFEMPMDQEELRAELLLMQLKLGNLKDDLEVISTSINELMDELNKINKGET